MTNARVQCSVVVLTLNEERNIAACLDSARQFDDVHVVDSGSTDTTVAIAERLHARMAHNAFAGFGQQRNWSHDHLPLRHPWVMHLDADERMTPALAAEIAAAIRADDERYAGYFIAERTLLRGRWLRRAAMYPRYQARLVHRGRMRFADHGHGQREVSRLPFGTLANPYDHLAFSQGVEHWLRKHASYAAKEAAEFLKAPAGPLVAPLLTGTAVQRHRALKRLGMLLPFRPLLRYLHVLFVKRGVLDGRAGWEYARMMRVYEEMIDLAIGEARDRRRAVQAPAERIAEHSAEAPK